MALDESSEAVRRTDVTVKTTREILDEQREAARRKDVTLKVTLVTLAWLVSVPLLIGWELTGAGGLAAAARTWDQSAEELPPSGPGYLIAAVLIVLLPFVAGVIATKNRRVFLGGFYVVLTLAMLVPAVSIAGMGR